MAKHSFDKVLVLNTPSGKRATRVIVLNETDEGTVYIPMNGIARIDYTRLKALYEKTDKDTLLEAMRDERLDMGKNALITYQDVIATYTPEPEKPKKEEPAATTEGDSKESGSVEEGQPVRKKPGPKPGSKNKRKQADKSEQGSDGSDISEGEQE